jgi:hypothetical protein
MASFSPWDLVPGVAVARHAKDITNDLGITTPTSSIPNPANSVDATRTRNLADAMQAQAGRPGGVAQTVAPTQLDQTAANQSRDITQQNIGQLQGVANGTTPTAADAMFSRGNDVARANAMGAAAAYSRANPGLALRAALTTGNQAEAGNTGAAAQQKLQEQEGARNQIGNLANSMRSTDLGAAGANQAANMQAQQLNQGAGLQQQGLNNQFQLGSDQLAGNLTVAPLAAQSTYAQMVQQQNQANQAGVGAGLTAIGGALKSDKRSKKNMRTTALADALAKNVHGITFEYKPETGEDQRKHAGVTAQELERAVPGVVSKDRTGTKVVDTRHLSTANTATIAELARRLRKLEGRKAA